MNDTNLIKISKVIRYQTRVDNNIWIAPNLPYPVKAQTFADVTSGIPPIQYAFDLQATGQGQPPTHHNYKITVVDNFLP